MAQVTLTATINVACSLCGGLLRITSQRHEGGHTSVLEVEPCTHCKEVEA